MRIVCISCYGYRDCWNPLLALLDKYWPDHPPVSILTDTYTPFNFTSKEKPRVFVGEGRTWCERVAVHANYVRTADEREPIFLIQEDFFLKKPVSTSVIEHAFKLLKSDGVGLVRLYPSPPGTKDINDPYFAEVPKGEPYRISCHAALWDPAYLSAIAMGANWTTGEARDFENLGSPKSSELPQRVLAIKEGVDIPFEYVATGISRGLWNPEALRLFEDHGLDVDRSMRPIHSSS